MASPENGGDTGGPRGTRSGEPGAANQTAGPGGTRWRRLQADGTEWEARVVPGSERLDAADREGEVVEFVCVDGSRKPRRLAVARGFMSDTDDAALERAYRQARPIGGDHYGRPGKPANDAP